MTKPVDARNIPALDSPRRCRWARHDPLLADYHDFEWGWPIAGDDGHLERMALEIFQCGLSWKIILVKRQALREAFRGFDVEAVARMTSADVARMLRNPEIIRNRLKIEATIHNAGRFREIIRSHGGYRRWLDPLAVRTPAQRREVFALFKRTFRFMGPETTKCYLWGVGKVAPPHERACWLRTA
jgi:DNA-3-methyladenine glycosylase I